MASKKKHRELVDLGLLFGTRLRGVIERRGYSPDQFAAMIGKSPIQVQRYMQNEQYPRIDLLKTMCILLQVSPTYLIGLGFEEHQEDVLNGVIKSHHIVKQSVDNFSIYWDCIQCGYQNVQYTNNPGKVTPNEIGWQCYSCGSVHYRITNYSPSNYKDNTGVINEMYLRG